MVRFHVFFPNDGGFSEEPLIVAGVEVGLFGFGVLQVKPGMAVTVQQAQLVFFKVLHQRALSA